MSEAGLHPLESILRMCAAAAPEPWYPRLFVKQSGVDSKELASCLEELWQRGLIERTPAVDEKGPAMSLTREGQRVLLDPEALERLRRDQPLSSADRGAILRQALSGRVRPLVTIALVLINVAVFTHGYVKARAAHVEGDFLRGNVEPSNPPTEADVIKSRKLMAIHSESGALSAGLLMEGQWWRLLTAGFVHFGFLHLLLNMVFLYLAGRYLELMWGPIRYLVIYLAAVLGGCCLAVVHTGVPVAGASGGVCGLLAAEAVWFLFNRRYLPRALLGRARTAFLINLVLLVFISSFGNVGGWGHFGGAATGAMAAMLLQLQRFGPPLWRWLALAGFAPMVWYGHYLIDHARMANPDWIKIQDDQFDEVLDPAFQSAVKEAFATYRKQVKPVVEQHPTRRDAEAIDAARAALTEQQGKLNAMAERFNRAGPYGNPVTAEARQAGLDFLHAMLEWFAEAERHLNLGEKRTDKDRQLLRQREQQVRELRGK